MRKFQLLTPHILLEYRFGSVERQEDFNVNEFAILETPRGKLVLNPEQYDESTSLEFTNNIPSKTALRYLVNRTNKHVWLGKDVINPTTTDWVKNEGAANDIQWQPDASPTNPTTINTVVDSDDNLQRGVLFDTVRLHFVSGFRYDNDVSGLILSAQLKDDNDERILLGSHLFSRLIHEKEFHPAPFLYGEKMFDTFIEFKIPSPKKLTEDWEFAENEWSGDPATQKQNSLLHNLTDVGVHKHAYILFQLAEIHKLERINALMRNDPDFVEQDQNYLFFYTVENVNSTMPFTGNLSNINVELKESKEGDYFEFKGLYNNLSIRDYILELNNRSGKHILIYDVKVLEHIDDGSGNIVEKETGSYSLYQKDNFESPVKFRPIVTNESALAFTLEVTMRLFNTTTGVQNNTTSRITLTESNEGAVHRYGKVQNVIALSEQWPNFNFERKDIYNLNPASQIINLPDTINDMLIGSNIRYLNVFHDSKPIVLNQNSVTVDEEGQITKGDSINITKLFGNGKLFLELNESTNYIKFAVYDKTGNYFLRKDLSGIGEFWIRFGGGDSNLKWPRVVDEAIQSSQGELLFKIPKDSIENIKKKAQKNKVFEILLESQGEETTMYSGEYGIQKITPEEEEDETETLLEEKENLQQEIEELRSKLETKSTDLTSKGNKIKELKKEISKSKEEIEELKELIKEITSETSTEISPTEDNMIIKPVINSGSDVKDSFGAEDTSFRNKENVIDRKEKNTTTKEIKEPKTGGDSPNIPGGSSSRGNSGSSGGDSGINLR